MLLWRSSAKVHIDKLIIQQKKAVTIIAHTSYNAHLHDVFQSFQLLHIVNTYKCHVGKYQYKQMQPMFT